VAGILLLVGSAILAGVVRDRGRGRAQRGAVLDSSHVVLNRNRYGSTAPLEERPSQWVAFILSLKFLIAAFGTAFRVGNGLDRLPQRPPCSPLTF
jgi:hypothetical protein